MTLQEFTEAIDKICPHLRNAAEELAAAKSYSSALMSKLKFERTVKGYKNGGPWWAITSTFKSASQKAIDIIEERIRHWDIMSEDARTK